MLLINPYKNNSSDSTTISYIVKEKPTNYNRNQSETHKKQRVNLLKRIPLDRLMDLKVDYAFKQLFGNENNKQITVVFLNAILQKSGREQIKEIVFANIEAGGEYVDDKQSKLDILVVTESGESINVEIQFTDKYDMIKRSIYYWAGTYRSPLHAGMSYKELKSVISINIMNFNFLKQTKDFHNIFHLYEDKEKFKLTNIMEFHFIEMPKLIKAWQKNKLDPWNDVLARWLLLLGMVDRRNKKVYEEIYQELEEIAMVDKDLQKAFHNWEDISRTQEQFLAYESRVKQIMDEESFKREAVLREQEANREGEIRGKEIGKQETLDLVVQRLLQEGEEINFIVKITGLSKQNVIDIQQRLNAE